MRKKALFLGVMALVAVFASLGLWHDSRSNAAPVTSPIQPFTPDWSGSGVDTTALGATTVVLTDGVISQGQRIAIPWIFGAAEFGTPLDIDSPTAHGTSTGTAATTMTDSTATWTANQWAGDVVACGGRVMTVTSNTGTVLTGSGWSSGVTPTNPCTYFVGTNLGTLIAYLDVQCDGNPGGVDTLSKRTGSTVPYDWIENSTVSQSIGDDWLRSLVPPYPWLYRQTVVGDTFWLSGTTPIDTAVVLNTVFTNVPWSVNGGANTATTKNGGDPRAWTAGTDANCIDTPQDSISESLTASNPVATGDTGGPCTGGNCADAAIYGLWTDDTVTGSDTVTVHKVMVNNGPNAGNFSEHWEIELTRPDIMDANWSTGGAKTLDVPVALPVATTATQDEDMDVSCTGTGEGLIVLKNILWPVSPTTDYYPDDNAQVFVVRVVCGTAATTLVDKAVIWVKPTAVSGASLPSTPTQVNLLPGTAATVTLREVKVNNHTANVTGNEWLVAEVNNTVVPDPLSVLWGSTVSINGGAPTATTSCGAGDACIKYDATEVPGQNTVEAQLTVDCPATITPGRYSVVVKAIDAPASPLGESKPADNAQRYVLKVNCLTALDPDGIDDAAGLYARWIIAVSNPGSRALYSIPPSIPSDTGPDSKLQQPIGGYVERIIQPGCYWIDSNGCATCDGSLAPDPDHPADGFIDQAESQQDPDLLALGGMAAVDPDGDCAMTASLAQPGHFVDLPSDQVGDCDPLPYSLSPSTVITFSKNADHDCDGLPDGIEKSWGSNPLVADTDGDGANDFVEMFQFTNPGNPDTDGDGFLDKPSDSYGANTDHAEDNCPATYNPTQANSDSLNRPAGPTVPSHKASNPNKDKMGDACDPDNDNDGLPNTVEGVMGTNPSNPDTDDNHCVDGSEALIGKNPATADGNCPSSLTLLQTKFFRACHWNLVGGGAELDPDGDGTDCSSGTSVSDKDNDNFTDLAGTTYQTEVVDVTEIEGFNTNPANVDTDSDGCYDYVQINDVDGDGVVTVLDVLLVAKRAANIFAPNAVSDRVLDVNRDGSLSILDTFQVAKNQCSVHGNQGGCGTASGTPCKVAASLPVGPEP